MWCWLIWELILATFYLAILFLLLINWHLTHYISEFKQHIILILIVNAGNAQDKACYWRHHLLTLLKQLCTCFAVHSVFSFQQMLHRNLVYLATIADSSQNVHSLLPVSSSHFLLYFSAYYFEAFWNHKWTISLNFIVLSLYYIFLLRCCSAEYFMQLHLISF